MKEAPLMSPKVGEGLRQRFAVSQPFDFPGIASLLMQGSVRTRAIADRFAQTGQFFVLPQGVIKAGSRPAWARGLKRRPVHARGRLVRVAPRVGAWVETQSIVVLSGPPQGATPPL